MPAHRRGGHTHRGRKLAGPPGSLTEQLHDLAPGWIGQGPEDHGDVVLGRSLLAHGDNS